MIINKYLAGLLAVFGTVAFAFQQAVGDNSFDPDEAWNLAGLFFGSVVAIIVPLLKGPWAAALKVVSAVALGVIGAVIGVLATGDWTLNTWTTIIFAGVNALLIQLGVAIRTDQVASVIADPRVANAGVIAADRPAVQVVSPESIGADQHTRESFRP